MRDVKRSGGRLMFLGWLLPLVLLALPRCVFHSGGLGGEPDDPPPCEGCPPPPPKDEFLPGSNPTEAIFCDIPEPLAEGDDGCATQAEADDATNISLAEAATALANGEFKSFALDWSDPAACGGLPKKIKFFGDFPDGLRVCINCGERIPVPYATLTKACIAKCTDLVNQNGVIPDIGASAYCEANVKLATNSDPDMCVPGACTSGGNPNLNWVDPRRQPEPVKWIDHIGTSDNGGTNDLERTDPTTGTMTVDFNAGAASAQTIKSGDAWVEFAAGDGTDKVHVLGVRESCADPFNCPDLDPHIETVGYAIDLNSDGMVYVLEPDPSGGPFLVQTTGLAYTLGERFRVRVTQNIDGTATISYSRLVGGVDQAPFHITTSSTPNYPLRVDTTFREQGARISDVTLVRIK